MAQQVCSGATLTCSFGNAPSHLGGLPACRVAAGNRPTGTIMDHALSTNVTPFGMCTTASNPQVSAAGGPVPCVPATPTPWTPGSPTVRIGGQSALSSACQLSCTWGGVITVGDPGQRKVNVP